MADELSAYRADPTPDNLIRLLRAHQDTIYRLCFQVLGRAHDAEDAVQEVLIKIVDGVRKFDDPVSFQRWLYRVSINAALEHARKAARRRSHESRAAMEAPQHAPLDEEARRTLFEGLARLDDEPRSILLEHYFAGRTMESIASSEGISPQAVSKRLERAREDLKRAVPLGFLMLPDLRDVFTRGGPPSVGPDLVSGPVLAKIESIAVGGVIMASKSSMAAVAGICLIACLGVGTGSLMLLRASRDPAPAVPPSLKGDGGIKVTAANAGKAPAVEDEGADGRAVAAAKRRILEGFAKHYSKLNQFAPAGKDKAAGMYLRSLIENKDLKALAASLAEDESGHSQTALRELHELSNPELRQFALLLLAQGGRSELEPFFMGIVSRTDDLVGCSLAAFGLGNIGSPTAMSALAGAFRSSFQGGKPDYTPLHALCLRPTTGLPHLVAIAEELVGMGRSTLEEFRTLGMAFPCDSTVVDQLQLLAETHGFPAIRMLALRPLIGLMRSKEDLATFTSAVGREEDPAVRAEILRMTKECVVRGELKAMHEDARRLLSQEFSRDFGTDQGARMRFFLKLVPEDQMGLAHDVLLGEPAKGVDVEKLDAVLFEELPNVTSPEARRMMLDYTLKMGVEDCLNPLHALAAYGPLTEERLIEPLIDLVQRVEAGKSRAHMATAIRTLTGFAEEFRPRILAQLESLYATTQKPEVRTAVLEWGFARMGPAGEELLVREAAFAPDPSCRIAAWSLLQKVGTFERRPDLQEGAKRFLQSWNPSGDPGGASPNRVQARYYVELFSSIYLHAGTANDLPILRRMAEKPELAGADSRLLESLGRSAAAAVELIELRARLN